MIGVYKITSPTGAINIGQSWDTDKRKNQYRFSSNVRSQTVLYRSYKKYGAENHKFEVILELPEDITQKVLDQLEIAYIAQYKECGFSMLNLQEGGRGGKHSEQTKKKLSEKHKSKKIPKEVINKRVATRKRVAKERGYYLDPEHKEKLLSGSRGRIVSEETRKKISESRKGKNTGKRPESTGEKISKALTGKKLSVLHKLNLSISHIGIRMSEERRKKNAKMLRSITQSPEFRKNAAIKMKERMENSPLMKCLHCGYETRNIMVYKRYHGEKCKNYKNE